MPAPISTGNGFAQRLRKLRQERSFTQQQLAQKAQVHYTHISRYEADKSKPAADTLRRLAEALATTTDYLMDGATEDTARTRLSDKALLQRFQEVEQLPEHQKETIMELMDAFLAMNQLRNYTNRAG
jgi:transcriptional regulator with XRE-family HTH domain